MTAAIGAIAPAPLEDWFRHRYFDATIDIAGSGVQDYSLAELRRLLGISTDELDGITFGDSPSVGAEQLRAAVADRYAPGLKDSVMITHGSSEAIFLAMAALVRPGDEVVVADPGYHALISTVTALGGSTKVWLLDSADGFEPDLERLRTLLSARTRAVVVNFPHNPTGVSLDRARYDALLETVERSGAVLLWDGAFTDLVYDTDPLAYPNGTLGRCISFGTLSKAYGLPGLRVGWAVAPADVIADMVRLRDYLTLATSPLTEVIAARVVQGADILISPRLAQARANRETLRQWSHDHRHLIDCPLPRGGVTAFPRLRPGGDVTALCEKLVDRYGVLVVPGACFGRPDRMRIGFGGQRDRFAEGLAILADVLTEAAR